MDYNILQIDMNMWNPDRPIGIAELATVYPKIIRRLSSLNRITSNFIECDPQPGEQTRFGVFFHALSQVEADKDLGSGSLKVIMPIEELPSCCPDRELVEKGVLIFPSAAYQLALSDLQLVDPSLDRWTLDSAINRQWIILDEAAVKRTEPPILSIPSKVRINTSRLIR